MCWYFIRKALEVAACLSPNKYWGYSDNEGYVALWSRTLLQQHRYTGLWFLFAKNRHFVISHIVETVKYGDKVHNSWYDNTGKLNWATRREKYFLWGKAGQQRITLTVATVNCIWHGAALISCASLCIHLRGSLPGVVPPSNPGTHWPVATTTDVVARLSAVPGGTNGDRRREWRLCSCHWAYRITGNGISH